MSKVSKPAPTPASVAAAFQKLKTAATRLNQASDGLVAVVGEADAILKDLNTGVSTFVSFAGKMDTDFGDYWYHEVGYCRVDSKWGIAIRKRAGDLGDQENEQVDLWLFADAPRAFRDQAVDRLPDLFEALAAEADKMADRFTEKIAFTQQIISVVREAATIEAIEAAAAGGRGTPGEKKSAEPLDMALLGVVLKQLTESVNEKALTGLSDTQRDALARLAKDPALLSGLTADQVQAFNAWARAANAAVHAGQSPQMKAISGLLQSLKTR